MTSTAGQAPAVTRCPACQTAFRVTADQLYARNGQVRCGRCLTVFNALEHRLAEEDNFAPPGDTAPSDETAPGDSFGEPNTTPGQGAETSPHPDEPAEPGDLQHDPMEPRPIEPLPGADAIPSFLHEAADSLAGQDAPAEGSHTSGTDAPDTAQTQAHQTDQVDIPPESNVAADHATGDPLQSERESQPLTEAAVPLQSSSLREDEPDAMAPVPNPEATAPVGLASAWSYSQERQRKPGRTWPRWFGHASWFMLLLLMIGQAAFHFRGDLALLFPQLRPVLTDACAALDCTLPLPHRTDLMSIESSELQADGGAAGVMVLAVTLRNKAPFAQEPPALELTLTDVQEQAVARRVITAREYLPHALPGPVTSQADTDMFPPGAELTLKIRFDASALPAAGYRLYLFHP